MASAVDLRDHTQSWGCFQKIDFISERNEAEMFSARRSPECYVVSPYIPYTGRSQYSIIFLRLTIRSPERRGPLFGLVRRKTLLLVSPDVSHLGLDILVT